MIAVSVRRNGEVVSYDAAEGISPDWRGGDEMRNTMTAEVEIGRIDIVEQKLESSSSRGI